MLDWCWQSLIAKSCSGGRAGSRLSGAAADEPETTNEEQFEFDVQRVKAAIRDLPENYRVIFNLFVIDELKQDEIASLLNISHNNVRIIYHRAKKKVLDLLNSNDHE